MQNHRIAGKYRKLFKRCAQKYFPGEEKTLLAKADRIFDGFKKETPSIGGKKNMLAGNLEMAMAFFAFHEATGRKLTGEQVLEMAGWMTEGLSFAKRILDFNQPWVAKLMYKVYIPYAKKVARNKANGSWGNAWGVVVNPEGVHGRMLFSFGRLPTGGLCEKARLHGHHALPVRN